MKFMIRKDRTIEAIAFDDCGVSHHFASDAWWAWDGDGGINVGIRSWTDHPTPDALWARFVARRLMNGTISASYLLKDIV